jgi:hypothetical protein
MFMLSWLRIAAETSLLAIQEQVVVTVTMNKSLLRDRYTTLNGWATRNIQIPAKHERPMKRYQEVARE